MYLTNLNLARV